MAKTNKNQIINKKSDSKFSQVIVYLGVLILLAVFPLYYDRYYYNILSSKYMFYYCTILIMTAGVLVVHIIPFLIKSSASEKKLKVKSALENISTPDWCMICILLVATISTLQSDFLYESFWGNEARYNGLFLWLIYGLSYLVITRLLKFKNSLLDFFLIAGMLVCLVGITDYFQLDILGFKANMREVQKKDFASTIGNVNLYTSYVCMVVAVAMTFFTTSKNNYKLIFYYIILIISFFAIIMGRSDNGYLALGALFAGLPFYLFKTNTGIKRFAISIATLLSCVWVVRIANQIWPDRVLYLDSVFGIMSRSDKLIYGVVLLWVLVLGICLMCKTKENDKAGKWPFKMWAIFIGLCFATGIIILYDANIAGNGVRYGSLSEYLVFSDSWGTDRGFVWKLSMNHFKEFSIVRKLFGYGPDTFGILTHYNDFDTMVEYNNTIFESAHNEYIHYLLTIGLLGTMAYVMLLCTSCYEMIKKCSKNPCAIAIAFAVIAYAAQATVNIAQPIVTPIMFTLLMIGLNICRNQRNDN